MVLHVTCFAATCSFLWAYTHPDSTISALLAHLDTSEVSDGLRLRLPLVCVSLKAVQLLWTSAARARVVGPPDCLWGAQRCTLLECVSESVW